MKIFNQCTRIGMSVLAMLMIGFTTPVMAKVERQVYLGDPININLRVNGEKRITFPGVDMVWADVKDKLKERLEIQVVNNNLHLKAKDSFKKTRITIGEEGGSNIYLLDIAAHQGKGSSNRMIIVQGKDRLSLSPEELEKEKPKETVIAPLKKSIRSPSAGYKTLISYALREIYAPERLRGGSGIYREKVNRRPVFHLLRDPNLLVKPLAAWRSGGLHVTALDITNKSASTVELEAPFIRGHWKAAAFRNTILSRSGTPRSNTTLFLVSEKKFDEAVESNPVIRIGGR